MGGTCSKPYHMREVQAVTSVEPHSMYWAQSCQVKMPPPPTMGMFTRLATWATMA